VSAPSPVFVRRFDAYDRVLHGLLMCSFLGLAATGLPLLFSDEAWARRLSHVLGSFEVAGWFHRFFALLLITVFSLHLTRVIKRVVRQKDYGMLWGPRSMVPQPRDLTDLIQHFKWFLGMGPRPSFDRFTYWEKFDYMAVFWGVVVIGSTGLCLWFPELFTRVLPGWSINVATIIHSDEALLATGFIFTIHFFNTHFRPEKFPMDPVIFTGSMSLAELEHDRPELYQRLKESGELEAHLVDAPSPAFSKVVRVFGMTALTVGLTLAALILYALVKS
jgi:cytochrome b subunit of formate dehydrogenase